MLFFSFLSLPFHERHPTILEQEPVSAPTPLLLDRLHTLPFASQVLLPQTNLVITSADSQYVPAQAPANPPQHMIEGQDLAVPDARGARIGRPDPDGFVL